MGDMLALYIRNLLHLYIRNMEAAIGYEAWKCGVPVTLGISFG